MPAVLSKSRLLSARQCAKRLWLEVQRPALAVDTPAACAARRSGQRVGEAARAVYRRQASGVAALVGDDEGLQSAVAKTQHLLAAPPAGPLFEATLKYAGVVVRADVLRPHGGTWDLIEVKASAALREEYLFDCAVQQWVFASAGVGLRRTIVANVDTSFVYSGDGDYSGLLLERDVSGDAAGLAAGMPARVAEARAVLAGPVPAVPVGSHCFRPRQCPFTAHCWPDAEFPIRDLGGDRAALGALVAAGYRDLREVPEERLTERQRRIRRVTREGRRELSPVAAAEMAALPWPRYYLDFETIAPAVPRWRGTRPYEVLPFQWSCHYEASPGKLGHADFLDLSGDAPMRRVAESLVRVLGRDGPVLTYTGYERRVIEGLLRQVPDLAVPLRAVLARLADLEPLVRRHYYHPAMHGSWSLKAVLPTVAPDLRYDDLEEIHDGTSASEGYLEAIDPATPAARRAAIERRLKAYCRLDTLAMVRLAAFLESGGTLSRRAPADPQPTQR